MAFFFTSDPHFGHKRLVDLYPHRSELGSVDAVDQKMIENWNAVVGHDDIIFVLGDLGNKINVLNRCIPALNGNKVLILGNHDKKVWQHTKHYFSDVLTYHEERIDGNAVVMFHYPIWEWNMIHYGSYHIHGHVHGKPTGIPGRIMDVSMDAHSLHPVSWDQLNRFMQKQEVRKHR